MGKRKEYRKIIKNYKEQKIVFQEEMKLDYSKLEETIAEAIKIEKDASASTTFWAILP